MFLKSNNLGKFPELIHGFTTRELGVDYPRIAQELGLSESAFFTLKQVHSNQVLVLSPSPQPSPLKGEGVRKIPPPLRGGG
ncbi:MAG: hypothetical protein HY541_09645, partial [Deltaproteobacteria bacterium]|nr:hypothetical protein [Deltaproteobacteria bacterium]